MRDESDAKEDSSARVAETTPWHVVEVRPLSGHRLSVRFADGTRGIVDVTQLVFGSAAGVFEGLRDPKRFEQVGIVHGAVSWPGELDLAPDAMYDEIRSKGSWTPQ